MLLLFINCDGVELYKTVGSFAVVRKEFRNSTFIGHVRSIDSEAEARTFIDQLKEQYSDANHNVSAYLIKNDNALVAKYDDDGEPAGSSGKPVFKVLELKGLSNTVVVVTRYFGGIKLGFGGLSRAYRETAVAAIEEAGIVEVHEMVDVVVRLDYSDMQSVKRLAEEYGQVTGEDYSDVVELSVKVRKGEEDGFADKLTNLTRDRAKIVKM